MEEISGGRIILGLGAGWHGDEYRAFGYPFDRLVSRFEEALPLSAACWWTVPWISKAPITRPEIASCARAARAPTGPRFMIGSTGKRMLRITVPHVQMWNAWLCSERSTADEVPARRELVDAAAVTRVGIRRRWNAPSPSRWNRPEQARYRRVWRRIQPRHFPVRPRRLPPASGISHSRVSPHLQVALVPNTIESIESFGKVLEELDR